MRTLCVVLPLVAVTMAIAPARAQRYDPAYPVCLQRWQWGGSNTIYCSYTSWDQCKAAASGLAAMCLVNPYWSQAHPRDRTAFPGAGRESWTR